MDVQAPFSSGDVTCSMVTEEEVECDFDGALQVANLDLPFHINMSTASFPYRKQNKKSCIGLLAEDFVCLRYSVAALMEHFSTNS